MKIDTPETLCCQHRCQMLSFMASMSVAANEMRSAEGYLLEMLAWVSFADRTDATIAEA